MALTIFFYKSDFKQNFPLCYYYLRSFIKKRNKIKKKKIEWKIFLSLLTGKKSLYDYVVHIAKYFATLIVIVLICFRFDSILELHLNRLDLVKKPIRWWQFNYRLIKEPWNCLKNSNTPIKTQISCDSNRGIFAIRLPDEIVLGHIDWKRL